MRVLRLECAGLIVRIFYLVANVNKITINLSGLALTTFLSLAKLIGLLCILALVFLLTAAATFADTYQVSVGWVDNTPIGADYVPSYEIEYQIDIAASVSVKNLSAPAWSNLLIATPNQVIKVRARNTNTKGPLYSAWTLWASGSTQAPPTQPLDPSGLTITIIRVP